MREKEFRAKVKQIARINGVKLLFSRRNRCPGTYYYHINTIVLNPYHRDYKKFKVDIFCHELGHALDHRRGLFKAGYNKPNTVTRRNIDKFRQYYRLLLRVEMHADDTGEALCKIWFPKYQYYKLYHQPAQKRAVQLEARYMMQHIKRVLGIL